MRSPVAAAGSGGRLRARRGRADGLRWTALGLSALSGLSLLAVVALLAEESVPVLRHQGLTGYLLGTRWYYRAAEFGALPMVYGTLAVAGLALVLATPVGLGAAIFTSEILGERARLPVKLTIELLAGVPSVVYGLLGVLVLRGAVFRLLAPWDPLSGDSLATGGILLAVMVLPTLVTFADDALRGVPRGARLAARALGLTRAEAIFSVTLPRALPGLSAALLLSLGRALGETIAVFLVVGRQDNQWPARLLSLAPLTEPGQTLTTKLGGSETFLAYGDPLHWAAMMGLALLLLALVLAATVPGTLLGGGKGSDAPRP